MIDIHESPLDFSPKGSSWAFELTMQIFKQFLSHISNASIPIPKNINKINHFLKYLRKGTSIEGDHIIDKKQKNP